MYRRVLVLCLIASCCYISVASDEPGVEAVATPEATESPSTPIPTPTPVPAPTVGISLPELLKSVERCSLLTRKTAEQADECAERSHQLSLYRRAAKFEQQRSDALESYRTAKAACASDSTNCDSVNRAQWGPVTLRVPSDTDITFHEFFLHYAVDVRPAVLPFNPIVPTAGTKLEDVEFQRSVVAPFRPCGCDGCSISAAYTPAFVTGVDVPPLVAAKQKLTSMLNIPFMATTDYLQRLGGIVGEMRRTNQDPNGMYHAALEYITKQWPKVYSTSHIALHVSPLGMHRVIMPLYGSLKVRLVNGEQTAYFYPNVTDMSFPPDVDVFHPDLSKYPALQLVSGVEALVGPGQVLFVPSGTAVSWHAVTASGVVVDDTDNGGLGTDTPVVLELCYVDASNLNRVKAELKVAALQSAKMSRLLELLQSTTLQTDIDRKSTCLPYTSFVTWPRAAVSGEGGEDSAGDGTSNGNTESSSSSSNAKAGGRRGAAAAGSKSRANRANRLKDWQEDKKWQMRVRQLAMPAPSTPLVRTVGRRNVTLEWRCPNEGGAGHTHDGNGNGNGNGGSSSEGAVKGYSVVWHAQSLGPEVEVHSGDSAGNGVTRLSADQMRASGYAGVPYHNHTIDEQVEDVDMSKHSLLDFDVSSGAEYRLDDPRTRLVVGCGGISADIICVTISNLLPNHLYVFRVAAITDIGTSTYSESSPTARTQYLTVPQPPVNVNAAPIGAATARLVITANPDDGGLPVLGYVVFRQENWLGQYMDPIVALRPSSERDYVDILGLVPATGYRFIVGSINAAGTSQLSQPSNGITTKAISEGGTMTAITGVGATATSEARHLNPVELAAVRTIALSFLRSPLNTDPTLTVDMLLDRSGFGVVESHIAPMGFIPAYTFGTALPISHTSSLPEGVVATGSGEGALDAAVTPAASTNTVNNSADSPVSVAQPPTSRVVNTVNELSQYSVTLPCLGPVVTVSDTQQSLVIHLKEPITIPAWAGHHSPRKYDVKSEVVASKPLSGLQAKNTAEFVKRVVYFDRGELSLRDKVRFAAQHGALAVVIGDNTGRCKNHEFTQVCVPGGDKRRNEGFAKTDAAALWAEAKIPVLVIEQQDAELLKRFLL